MDWGYAKGLGRSALGGATFEFGDELEAALRALPPGSPGYDRLLKQIRAEQGRFEEANPGAALAANLGGAVLGGGGVGLLARTGSAAGRTAKGLVSRATARPGAYGALGGAATGAGVGGDVSEPVDYSPIPALPVETDTQTKVLAGLLNTYNAAGRGLRGLGLSDSATDRVLSAGIGAPLGAAAGKLLPPAIQAALRRKRLLALSAAGMATSAGSEPQGYAGGGAVRAEEAPVITIGG